MSDNVLILGAGFSHDAGIPLLGTFVDRMWEYAKRKKAGDQVLTEEQLTILDDALNVRMELDEYHGRATFDAWNIEDILSILSFNVLGGDPREKNKLEDFIKAIALTIELSCNVKHEGVENSKNVYRLDGKSRSSGSGPDNYRMFWKHLIKWVADGNEMPSIITFNYDLVLERSLFQILIGHLYRGVHELPFKTFSLDYKLSPPPFQNYCVEHASWYPAGGPSFQGVKVGPVVEPDPSNHLNIPIMKLHGSVNFPRPRSNEDTDFVNLSKAIEHPFIIPPLSNKAIQGHGSKAWRGALNTLRSAKNVVVVGYSLPETDTHMQYFLKAALGPVKDLNRIFVFDPALYKSGECSDSMRNRYNDCFAEQLRPRISFTPPHEPTNPDDRGKLSHFLQVMRDQPDSVFFSL